MSFGEKGWGEYWNQQGQDPGAERGDGETLLLKGREGIGPNASCVNTSTSTDTPDESKKVNPLQSKIKELSSFGQGCDTSSAGGTQAQVKEGSQSVLLLILLKSGMITVALCLTKLALYTFESLHFQLITNYVGTLWFFKCYVRPLLHNSEKRMG